MDLVLYTKIGLGDGQQSNNPLVTRISWSNYKSSWDNYVTVSKKDAGLN
jgi:molybdopterin-containing oxidoreductase family iron-sulfur binding subunit